MIDLCWPNISGFILKYASDLLIAVLIFILGKWLGFFLSGLLEKALRRAKVQKTLASFARNIIYYAILIFVAIAALNKLGIETNSFVALVGAAGLAVGFALQGSLANFASGVMIIFFEPFKAGDTIEVAGSNGVVEEIQMFHTILSIEDKRVIIPNAKITSDKVIVYLKKK